MRHVDTPVHRRQRWAPATRVGRWSAGLAVTALAGVALSVVGFATGVLESASSFSDNWLLTGWGLGVLLVAAAATGTGAVAVLGRGDRSGAVVAATLLGALVLVVILNEVVQGL
jgi:hypothetical protein